MEGTVKKIAVYEQAFLSILAQQNKQRKVIIFLCRMIGNVFSYTNRQYPQVGMIFVMQPAKVENLLPINTAHQELEPTVKVLSLIGSSNL